MAERRIILHEDCDGTLHCDACENPVKVDLSGVGQTEGRTRIPTRCKCGHQWTTVVNKRRRFRKSVNLFGAYTLKKKKGPPARGMMTVTDISKEGVRLVFQDTPECRVGDCLDLQFHLDDEGRTFIQKTVEVSNICSPEIGAVFGANEPEDPRIGYYLYG